MNKNEEQIKNEEITEDVDVVFRDPTAIEIDLGVVNLDTAFELSAFNKLADNNRVKSLILIVPHLKV